MSEPVARLMGKRAMGALNYYLGGRGAHFRDVESRITRLLEDIDSQGVDHALCTGDVTQMSYESEFERCAELFGDRRQQPERWTVIPGNHDRYTHGAAQARRFDRWFAGLGADSYPFAKQIAPGVRVVAMDVARPNAMLDSSGLCGPAQLERTKALLAEAKGDFVILALHYGLFRSNGQPDRKTHGIRDLPELIAVLESERVDLILHGHIHRAYQVAVANTTAVCAGSATDLYQRCGYNIYELDPEGRTFTTQRRVWDAEAEVYVDLPEGADSRVAKSRPSQL